MRARAAAGLAAALALAGCGGGGGGGGGSGDDPAGAVRSFAKAFGAGDGKKSCGLLTASGRTAFVKRAKPLAATDDCATAIERVHEAAGKPVADAYASATVAGVKVSGSTATAKLTAGGATTAVRLAKEDGEWRLASVPGL